MDSLSPDSSESSSTAPAYYPPQPDAFDELVSQDGSLRAHWQDFMKGFSALSVNERQLAQETAQRLLRDDGVTHVAGQDGQFTARPWQLDLFPLLINQEEWQALETGLIQRAQLLNHILSDLYGPQQLLKMGLCLQPSSLATRSFFSLVTTFGYQARRICIFWHSMSPVPQMVVGGCFEIALRPPQE